MDSSNGWSCGTWPGEPKMSRDRRKKEDVGVWCEDLFCESLLHRPKLNPGSRSIAVCTPPAPGQPWRRTRSMGGHSPETALWRRRRSAELSRARHRWSGGCHRTGRRKTERLCHRVRSRLLRARILMSRVGSIRFIAGQAVVEGPCRAACTPAVVLRGCCSRSPPRCRSRRASREE